MMESIEKLREFVDDQFAHPGQTYSEGMAIAANIEREIAEYYMRLPVDADGVPIRVGDVMIDYKTPRNVVAVAPNSFMMSGYETDSFYRPGLAKNYRHVNPRTIEDVLTDFANEVARQGHQIGLTGHELTMRYADEIRELMEVDA